MHDPPVSVVLSLLAQRYEIDREVARGGMAIVYLPRDLRHDRRVTIKVLRPELASAEIAERFLREIDIAAHLTHPNILPVHDSGAADGLPAPGNASLGKDPRFRALIARLRLP